MQGLNGVGGVRVEGRGMKGGAAHVLLGTWVGVRGEVGL